MVPVSESEPVGVVADVADVDAQARELLDDFRVDEDRRVDSLCVVGLCCGHRFCVRGAAREDPAYHGGSAGSLERFGHFGGITAGVVEHADAVEIGFGL
ncbi:hypothetical protein [Nesterenkonia pannonica]|uniref:hypothetical protein n=1 Tax=Nesterenkonia pannonica TaxID=1548602 RepID=UPI002164665C|nr:hypothetical protein [Nesterenkonia pannonica]